MLWVLKKGGILLAGLDNGINYAFDVAAVIDCRAPAAPLLKPYNRRHIVRHFRYRA
jgi:hypothetical protein